MITKATKGCKKIVIEKKIEKREKVEKRQKRERKKKEKQKQYVYAKPPPFLCMQTTVLLEST